MEYIRSLLILAAQFASQVFGRLSSIPAVRGSPWNSVFRHLHQGCITRGPTHFWGQDCHYRALTELYRGPQKGAKRPRRRYRTDFMANLLLRAFKTAKAPIVTPVGTDFLRLKRPQGIEPHLRNCQCARNPSSDQNLQDNP